METAENMKYILLFIFFLPFWSSVLEEIDYFLLWRQKVQLNFSLLTFLFSICQRVEATRTKRGSCKTCRDLSGQVSAHLRCTR